MISVKTASLVLASFLILTGSANAVTVLNKDTKEHKIGIDWGNKERVEHMAAGKSAKFDCPDGCGVTGPWGFSWMAKGTDEIVTNGKDLIRVGPLQQHSS
ncbi:MAG: hypothetical protein K2Q28_09190 [Hyphomicrobium sp.]|nr:hypothetical protein [Hyphomicrobium sp.]